MKHFNDTAWQNHQVMDHMLEINRIDSWLRGVKDFAPTRTTKLSDTFNRHSLTLDNDSITEKEISETSGFRGLVDKCSALDVQLDVSLRRGGKLDVAFRPQKPFSDSHIFDKSAKRLQLV